MEFEYVQNYLNKEVNSKCILIKKNLRLDRLANVIDSYFEGMNQIGDFSCVNRSEMAAGAHIGVSSYVADSKIGRFTMIGSRVSIGGFQHPTNWLGVGAFQWGQSIEHYNLSEEAVAKLRKNPKPPTIRTVIGNDVWIGDNAVIKAGCEIGNGAIIGAGSVVTKNVNPYEIYVGNPAKFLRMRFEMKIVEKLLLSQWWLKNLEELIHLDFGNIEKCIDEL